MFYEGKTYAVKMSNPAIKAALAAYIADGESVDALDAYDVQTERLYSLRVVKWLVRHLIPEFKEMVTEENKLQLMRGIGMAHNDPERAAILDIRDARRWRAAEDGPGTIDS
jgi:hypothetical protein